MCLDTVSETWFLHGIMSREGECLPKSHPDVFADTSLSLTWIEKTAGIQWIQEKNSNWIILLKQMCLCCPKTQSIGSSKIASKIIVLGVNIISMRKWKNFGCDKCIVCRRRPPPLWTFGSYPPTQHTLESAWIPLKCPLLNPWGFRCPSMWPCLLIENTIRPWGNCLPFQVTIITCKHFCD